MHDRSEIREAHAAPEAIRAIARRKGISRNAVRRAVRTGRDQYHRAARSEQLTEGVREVLSLYPRMAVADIAVLVDWPMSPRTLHAVVSDLRPAALANWEPSFMRARPSPKRLAAARLKAPRLQPPRLEVRRLQ